MKKESKKIKCYNVPCEREGKAYQVPHIRTNPKTKKEEMVMTWEAKGWKAVSVSSWLWLCSKCDKKRCKRCRIVLSNERVCGTCGEKHGSYYLKHPHYCKACWNEMKKN